MGSEMCIRDRVIPLYKKKRSKQDITNYRPIALLSNIDEMFEKLVHRRFVTFLVKNETIFDQRLEFRVKHPTSHNLLTLTETIRQQHDRGEFSYDFIRYNHILL